MRANGLKAKLVTGGAAINGWCSIANSYSAEIMACQGFDSVTIDLQHGAMHFETAFQMLQAISTTQATPLVRPPWNEPGILMKLLDAGAYGIICPMVNTAKDARDFVGACRYPPSGWRSVGPNRVSLYAGSDYVARANDETLLLAMIETREALSNLDAILDTPGLDGVYVGPADLSLSFGEPPSMTPSHPDIVAAIATILARAKAKGRIPAIHTDGPQTALQRYAQGYRMCTLQNDVRLLVNAANASVKAVRDKLPLASPQSG